MRHLNVIKKIHFGKNVVYVLLIVLMLCAIVVLVRRNYELKWQLKVAPLEYKIQGLMEDDDYPYYKNGTLYKGDVQIFFSPVGIDSEKTDVVVQAYEGDVIEFFAKENASMAMWFKLECDTSAFDVTDEMVYFHPEHAHQSGVCGGDGGTRVYRLETLKCGSFNVRCVTGRLTDEYSKTYKIIVQQDLRDNSLD